MAVANEVGPIGREAGEHAAISRRADRVPDASGRLIAVLALQQSAGNQAVADLLAGAVPQRGLARPIGADVLLPLGGGSGRGKSTSQKTVALQRQPPRPAGSLANPELRLGRRLMTAFPDGVTVAVYDSDDSDSKGKYIGRQAREWARLQQAIAPTSKTVTTRSLRFGRAIPDSYPVVATVAKLARRLRSAVFSASLHEAGPYRALRAVAGLGTMNAARIRMLAFFGHGTESGLGRVSLL